MKISAKINTMQNINIVFFVRSLSFKLKSLQLSNVGLSTINLKPWAEAT